MYGLLGLRSSQRVVKPLSGYGGNRTYPLYPSDPSQVFWETKIISTNFISFPDDVYIFRALVAEMCSTKVFYRHLTKFNE